MKKEEKGLLEEALRVYKIPQEYVFSSKVYLETDEVVIVTHGGKKFKHRKGEPAKFELTETEITGEPPEEEMVWDEKLNQRRSVKEILKNQEKGKQ